MTTLTTTEETDGFPENTPNLHTNLAQLEAIFNARLKTDYVFMNWWVGTFLMPFVTLGIYFYYRHFRNIHRRNQHLQRTRAFYSTLAQVLRLLPQASEKLTGQTAELLEDYEIRLGSKEAIAMAKPVHWKIWAWGEVLYSLSIIALFGIGIALAFSHVDPASAKKQIAFLEPYNDLISLINLSLSIYWYYLYKRLLEDYIPMDLLEAKLLSYVQPILRNFSNNDSRTLLPSFEPQCRPRNFWLHLLLLFPTLGINFLYLDYCCIHEAQRRFKESARVQYRILQAVKKLAEQSANEVTTS